MLSCKEVAKLVSESLDAELSLRQRIGVRMHLAMCHMCRAYRKQVLLMRQIFPAYTRWVEKDGPAEGGLSPEAAKRMKKRLIEHTETDSEKKDDDHV